MAAMMLVAFLPVVGAASSGKFTAQIACTDLTWDGTVFGSSKVWSVRSAASRSGQSGGAGEFELVFDAEHMDAHELYRAGYGVPGVAESHPRSGSDSWTGQHAGGRAMVAQDVSDVLIVAQDSGRPQPLDAILRMDGAFDVSGSRNVTERFRLGSSAATPGAQGSSFPDFEFRIAYPSLLSASEDADIGFEFQGNLTVYLFGIDVHATSASGGPRTLRSGNVYYNPLAITQFTPRGAVAESRYQILQLDLTGAHLWFEARNRPIRVYEEETHLQLFGSADVPAGSGEVRFEDDAAVFGAGRFQVTGQSELRLGLAEDSDGSQPPSVWAVVTGDASGLSIPDNAVLHPQYGLASPREPPVAAMIAVTIIGALIMIAFVAVKKIRQRQRSSQIDSLLAERAVIAGDFGTALSQANQALRQSPSDSTGLVAKAIALVQLDRCSEALAFATKAYHKEPSVAPIMAFLAAIAATRTGKARSGANWLAKAAKLSPEFAGEAANNPVFAQIRERYAPFLVRAGVRLSGHDPAPEGYN